MEIKKEQSGTSLTMFLTGRLDTVAAADFEKELNASLDGVENLVLDCAALTYVAATAVALAQLLRLMILFGGRRRDD